MIVVPHTAADPDTMVVSSEYTLVAGFTVAAPYVPLLLAEHAVLVMTYFYIGDGIRGIVDVDVDVRVDTGGRGVCEGGLEVGVEDDDCE